MSSASPVNSATTVPAAPALPTPGPAGTRMPNTWFHRLRRKLRTWVATRKPAADGWQPAGGPVLVIAPHPDDEVIGVGGTICRHARAGDPVTVIYLTRGEKSRGYPWLTGPQRQQTRMKEATASCRILGVTDTVFLKGADGHLAEPSVFNELAVQVAAAITDRQPKVIYVPHAADNHPDHIAAFRMICQIARAMSVPPTVYQYELWSPLTADFGVDVTRHMRAKVRAIKCHQSALDAFDYVPTMIGLAAYRSGTLLQHRGYAEAFRRTPDLHRS